METLHSLEDKTMKLSSKMVWIAAAGAVMLVATGCKNDKKEPEKPADAAFFRGDGEDRVSSHLNTQAANGARNDAMLYPRHFEAGHLNSLGRNKVMLMLQDCDNCKPIVVHLVNCGEGDELAARKASVELYLKTTEGPNALTFHPAQPEIIRLSKTESSTDTTADQTVNNGAGGSGAQSSTGTGAQ